jgi:hypothetical protein
MSSIFEGFATEADYKVHQLKTIREYHADLIKDLGITPGDFQMKMAFYSSTGKYLNKTVVGIFPSEFRRPSGLYIEVIGRDYKPITNERTVYRVPYNPHFEDEYELNERGSYYVPLEELRIVNPTSVAISKSSAAISSDSVLKNSKQETKNPAVTFFKAPISISSTSVDDAPYSDMTIRDYYAIHTGNPVSNKHWLNDLIKNQK